MAIRGRAIIIGIDGVPHELITRFATDGTMPNMRQILTHGTLRQMESSIPDVSCVAWSTVITGKTPGEHGMYGFMNLSPGTYRFAFPTFNDLKAAPLWEEAPGRRSVIVNIPATYPARELNGVMISGFVAIDIERAVYPRSLVPKLRELGYRIDVDAAKGRSDMAAFLSDCEETLEARIRAYRHLWEKEAWDLFFLVFTSTDRLSNFLFEAFEKKDHLYHEAFRSHFRRIDEIVGEIYGRLRDDDCFMMLSDHGFGVIEEEVNINYFLKERGFLNTVNPSPDSFDGVGEGSTAFALDPARIYVHTAGRYPRGCVKREDTSNVIEDLEEAFRALIINGRRVVRRICRSEEIFSGPCIGHAPDLVILPQRGFDLKSRLVANQLTSKSVFTGAHTQDDAFLFVRSGPLSESEIPAHPWVGDVRSLIEKGIAWGE